MSDNNNVATEAVQEVPARRGRPRKADAPRRERAGELRAKMATAAMLLLRAQRAESAVAKELIGTALDVLRGETGADS